MCTILHRILTNITSWLWLTWLRAERSAKLESRSRSLRSGPAAERVSAIEPKNAQVLDDVDDDEFGDDSCGSVFRGVPTAAKLLDIALATGVLVTSGAPFSGKKKCEWKEEL